VRWLLGEEINSPATQPAMVGAIRDMKNPPAYHDPDRITSAYYYTGPDDSGGVHTNSGVNNKAVYLLTDGGSFNGQVVTGLGIAKVAKIYYEAQTNYLTSGSDYQDLGRDLNQACANLVGTAGITLTDCDQVLKATVAVEMDRQPAANFNPEAEICPAGVAVNDTFFDDFESGLGKWSLTKAGGNQTWIGFRSAVGYPYATSGVESLFGPDVEVISDQQATIAVTVPAGQPYLHFRHAFDFEYDPAGGPAYYDGGVLEYSVNNGSSWIDAKNLIDAGKNYSGTIYNGLDGDNPLKGKAAYVGASHGYVSTRLNLTPLAGTNVKFRWRVGTDTGIGNLGWSLDDVRVYTCGNSSPVSNNPPTAVAGPAQTVYTGSVVTLNGGGSSDPGGNIVAYAWTQTGGTAVHLDNASAVVAGFTAPYKATILTFRLTVTDNDGAAASSETKVTVKMPIATASAGGGGGGGCSLSRNGEADPLPFLLFLASLVMAWRRRRRAASS